MANNKNNAQVLLLMYVFCRYANVKIKLVYVSLFPSERRNKNVAMCEKCSEITIFPFKNGSMDPVLTWSWK